MGTKTSLIAHILEAVYPNTDAAQNIEAIAVYKEENAEEIALFASIGVVLKFVAYEDDYYIRVSLESEKEYSVMRRRLLSGYNLRAPDILGTQPSN